MDLSFLAEADAVTLQLEKSKRALEQAKTDLDTAKRAYDELLSKADDVGIPKAKLKKLTEDRVQSLFDSGLLDFAPAAPKEAKPRKPKTKTPSDVTDENHSDASDEVTPEDA